MSSIATLTTTSKKEKKNIKTIFNLFSQYYLEQAAQEINNHLARSPASLAPLCEIRQFPLFSTLLIAIRANAEIMNALANIQFKDVLEKNMQNTSTMVGLRFITRHFKNIPSLNEFFFHFEDLCELIHNYENRNENLKARIFSSLFNFRHYQLDQVILCPSRATQSTAPEVDVNHGLSGEMCKYPNLYMLTANAIRFHTLPMCWLEKTLISDAWSACKLVYTNNTQSTIQIWNRIFKKTIKHRAGISLKSPLSTFFTRLEDLQNIVSTFKDDTKRARTILNRFNEYCLRQAGQQISNSLGQPPTPFAALPTNHKFSLFPTLLIAIRANNELMADLADINLADALKAASKNREIKCALKKVFLGSNHVKRTSSLHELVSYLEDSCTVIRDSKEIGNQTKIENIEVVLNFTSYYLDQCIKKKMANPCPINDGGVQQTAALPLDEPCPTITPGRAIKATQKTAPEVDVNYDLSGEMRKSPNLYMVTENAIRFHKLATCWLDKTSISDGWGVCKMDYIEKTQRVYTGQCRNLIERYAGISLDSSLSTFLTRREDLENIISTRWNKTKVPRTIVNRLHEYCLQQAGQQISNSLGQPSTPFAALPPNHKFSLFPTLLIAIRANKELMNALAEIKLAEALKAASHNQIIERSLNKIFLGSDHVTKRSSLQELVLYLEDSCTVIQDSKELVKRTKLDYVAAVLNFISYHLDQCIKKKMANPTS